MTNVVSFQKYKIPIQEVNTEKRYSIVLLWYLTNLLPKIILNRVFERDLNPQSSNRGFKSSSSLILTSLFFFSWKLLFRQEDKFSVCSLESFKKVATTWADLFIYWVHVASLTCKARVQSINTNELILCTQITRGMANFNGDFTVKIPCWHQVLNQWTSNPSNFFDLQSTFFTGSGHFHGSSWCFESPKQILLTLRILNRAR